MALKIQNDLKNKGLITLNLTHLTAKLENDLTTNSISFKLIPDTGYVLPDSITFSSGITDGSYNSSTGEVSFTAPSVDSSVAGGGASR